jgi:hypothetical protein
VTWRLAQIVRHPVKAAGWEDLSGVELSAGQALPWDRTWAVAHEAAQLEPGVWAPKQNFLRGVAAAQLMAVRARLDEGTGRLTLSHPQAAPVSGRPDDPAEASGLVDWLRPLWPANRPAPAALVRAGDQPFTDVPDPFVAVLNLASHRALMQRLGCDPAGASIHRWRGNLWLDDMAPWEEFDLVGHAIRVGRAILRIEERITRCRATMGNPETGVADADTLGALSDGWGHEDFGVYARVVEGGAVATGDLAGLA